MLAVMNEVLPADVLIGISGDREVGARIASHPDIDKIMFTGSTPPAARSSRLGGNLARLTLELGGNDAGIVLRGTDPSRSPKTCSGARSSTPGRPARP
jgi:acyl-CoA reductase-like NAD-dependent aldehyde dehydrogenase